MNNEETKLEEAQQLLEARGWKVERPAFDDPYEIMYRRMQRESAGPGFVHPDDDPTKPQYQWGDWDARALQFLKKHFVLKDIG
jgi:hypothetical protein